MDSVLINKSTTHALLDVVSKAYDNINHKNFTGLILLDLTKAFDTVCHCNLLLKSEHHGIRGNALNLITTYLPNKKQYDSINNISSSL